LPFLPRSAQKPQPFSHREAAFADLAVRCPCRFTENSEATTRNPVFFPGWGILLENQRHRGRIVVTPDHAAPGFHLNSAFAFDTLKLSKIRPVLPIQAVCRKE